MLELLTPFAAVPAAWLSTLFGVLLGAYGASRLATRDIRRRGVARAALLLGGALAGAITYIASTIIFWIFSWLEEPNPWEVLVFSVVVQAIAAWYGAFLLRRALPERPGPLPTYPVPEDEPPDPDDGWATTRATGGIGAPPAAPSRTAPRRAGAARTSMPEAEWARPLGGVLLLAIVYVAAFATMTPPFREKMVLLLWFQPAIGVAALVDRRNSEGDSLQPHERALRVGLCAVLLLASWVGLRLHYGLPVLPFAVIPS